MNAKLRCLLEDLDDVSSQDCAHLDDGVSLGHSVTRRHTKYRPWVPKFIARGLGRKRGCTTMRRYMATLPPMRVRPLFGYERRRPFFCGECDRVHPNGDGSACVTH